MDLLRRYPIYPGSCFILYTSYLIPVGLLVVVLQRSNVQLNCRIILTAWSLGMVGILTDEMYLMYVDLTPEDGEYISKRIQDPPHRPMVHVVHSIFYMCTSALEFLLDLERMIALRNVKSTAEPRYWYFAPYMAAWLAIAIYTAKAAFLDGNMILISACYVAVEISSIIIRETFYLSSAMFPVNVCGFCIKFSAAIVCWIYSLYYATLPYFVIEFSYQTLHATNCAVCTVMLMRGHPRMRRECLKILQRCFPLLQVDNNTTNSAADGNTYFAMLTESWGSRVSK